MHAGTNTSAAYHDTTLDFSPQLINPASSRTHLPHYLYTNHTDNEYFTSMKDIDKIRRLVGDVTPEQLTYVDYAVTDTIGLFMPVAGQCFYAITPEHTHPGWSFIVAFDSYCRTVIGGKIVESIPSTIHVLPPNIPHQELPSETVSRYIAVMIDTRYLATQLAEYSLSLCSISSGMTAKVNERLVDALKEFLTEYEEAAPGFTKLLDAAALKITHLIIRQLFSIQGSERTMVHRMSVTRAIEYLNEHYGEKITATDLAHVANCSPSHFSRIFKEETRLAPSDYLMRLRLDYAKRMLRGNEKSITQIALECGFNSSSYFYQCFFRTYNISPTDFRKSLCAA